MTTRARRLLLSGILLAGACDENPTAPSDFVGSTWRLESVQTAGAAQVHNPHPELFTLRLGADGQLGLSVHCNSCGGSYRVQGDTLHASPVACTLVLCAPLSDLPPAIESFPTLVEGESRVEVQGDHLRLSSSRVTLNFFR